MATGLVCSDCDLADVCAVDAGAVSAAAAVLPAPAGLGGVDGAVWNATLARGSTRGGDTPGRCVPILIRGFCGSALTGLVASLVSEARADTSVDAEFGLSVMDRKQRKLKVVAGFRQSK